MECDILNMVGTKIGERILKCHEDISYSGTSSSTIIILTYLEAAIKVISFHSST